jgi:hypothetical protein
VEITMRTIFRLTIVCVLAGIGIASALALEDRTPPATDSQSRIALTFPRAGALQPDDAALSLFLACAKESPQHFVQHLLLGVCDGPIDTLQKFAECLHSTRFQSGGESFTVYDLPRPIDTSTLRVVARREFDGGKREVETALASEGLTTYYAERFACVDVAAAGYDGREYQTRIVVAAVAGQWYAIPRCRSARTFYGIADAMGAGPTESDAAAPARSR